MLTILLASVVAFGAVGDGVHDDRPAIQAALDFARDAGDSVFFPRGTYRVTRAGSAYYTLRVDGVSIAGDGATLIQADNIAAAVRLLYVTGADVTIEDLTLDGNRAAQSGSEHRHGIFATAADRLRVRRVTSRHFTGDGFYLYDGVRDAAFDDVEAIDNTRNGITFGANVTGVDLINSGFRRNGSQQVDSEPGGDHVVSGITVTGCVFETDGDGDYALTLSGTKAATPGRDWRVTGSDIRGGVFVVWAENAVIAGNRIAGGVKPGVTVQRSSNAVRIVGNDITANAYGVYVAGTAGSGPFDVLLAGNRVEVGAGGFGVRADGAVDVDIVGNELVGGAVGVRVRATVPERPFERATVTGNRITGYTRAGVEVAGSGTAQLLVLEVERNVFESVAPPTLIAPGVVAVAP